MPETTKHSIFFFTRLPMHDRTKDKSETLSMCFQGVKILAQKFHLLFQICSSANFSDPESNSE